MKKFSWLALLTLVVGSLSTPQAHAITAAAKYDLNNQMGPIARRYQLGTLIESAENSLAALANGETIANGTDDTILMTSDDEALILRVEGFEAKSATLTLAADQGDDSGDEFSLVVSTADVLAIKSETTALLSFATSGLMTMVNGELFSNVTDDTVSFESDDEVMTFSVQGAEAKSGIFQLCSDQCDDAADKYSWTVDTSDVMTLKNGTTSLAAFAATGKSTETWTNLDVLDNAVDDQLEFLSEDSDSTIAAVGFEAKDGIIAIWADQGDDAADKWSLVSDHTANGLLFKNSTTQVYGLSSAGVITYADSETMTNASDVITFAFDDAAANIKVQAFEATKASITLQADESDDSGDDWQISSEVANTFTIANDTSGSQVAKFTMTTAGNITLVGSVTGDGGDAISGFIQKEVDATATTITIAQCGSTFQNTGAVQMELPEASTAIGCRLTFITANASNFDINPDNADQILTQTNAAGDATRNATLGNSITIQAISASQWAVVAINGTWTDIN